MKRFVTAIAIAVVAANASAADLVDTAKSAGSFNTLVQAVQAADLVETLKGAGPFTVFAPTDAAFAAIPAAQLEALLQDKAALTKVLTYHVVPGAVTAADLKAGPLTTVEGDALDVVIENGKVKVDNAAVITADIRADNGVIHVIDAVVMPSK